MRPNSVQNTSMLWTLPGKIEGKTCFSWVGASVSLMSSATRTAVFHLSDQI